MIRPVPTGSRCGWYLITGKKDVAWCGSYFANFGAPGVPTSRSEKTMDDSTGAGNSVTRHFVCGIRWSYLADCVKQCADPAQHIGKDWGNLVSSGQGHWTSQGPIPGVPFVPSKLLYDVHWCSTFFSFSQTLVSFAFFCIYLFFLMVLSSLS